MELLIFMFNSGCLGKFNVAFGGFFFLGRALNALKNFLAYTIPFRKSTGG